MVYTKLQKCQDNLHGCDRIETLWPAYQSYNKSQKEKKKIKNAQVTSGYATM